MKANYRSWVQLMIAIVTNSERSEPYKQRAKRCSSKSVIHFRVKVSTLRKRHPHKQMPDKDCSR